MKPYGLSVSPVGFHVSTPTKAMDLIWDAVEQAISEGMSPRVFRVEAAEAWESLLKEQAKAAKQEILAK